MELTPSKDDEIRKLRLACQKLREAAEQRPVQNSEGSDGTEMDVDDASYRLALSRDHVQALQNEGGRKDEEIAAPKLKNRSLVQGSKSRLRRRDTRIAELTDAVRQYKAHLEAADREIESLQEQDIEAYPSPQSLASSTTATPQVSTSATSGTSPLDSLGSVFAGSENTTPSLKASESIVKPIGEDHFGTVEIKKTGGQAEKLACQVKGVSDRSRRSVAPQRSTQLHSIKAVQIGKNKASTGNQQKQSKSTIQAVEREVKTIEALSNVSAPTASPSNQYDQRPSYLQGRKLQKKLQQRHTQEQKRLTREPERLL